MKTLHDQTQVEDHIPTKMINGKRYLLSQNEITVMTSKQAEVEAAKPMQDWLIKMQESDTVLSRVEEDILNQIGIEHFPSEVQDKYNEKTALRAEKPA